MSAARLLAKGLRAPAAIVAALFAMLFLPLLLAVSASARTAPCGERNSVVAALGARYGERVVAQAVTAGGLLIEILAAESGSWTIIVTRPDRTACIGASGEGWTPVGPARDNGV